MIGDAAMFASSEPAPVVEAVSELVETASGDEMPSLRAGVACGQALGRGGDWYGRPVNLASRITGFARPDTVVGSDELKQALEGDERFEFSFAGKHQLQGHQGRGARAPDPPRGRRLIRGLGPGVTLLRPVGQLI